MTPRKKENPRTLNERTALRWFLYALRLCNPEVLEELGEVGAPLFTSSSAAPALEEWYAPWIEKHWLPDTNLMREETEATLIYGYLQPTERRWHFEPPPQPTEAEQRLNEYVRSLVRSPSPAYQLQPDLPPFPFPGTEVEHRRWKREVKKRTWDFLRHVTEGRQKSLELGRFPPEVVWFLLAGSGEHLSPKRSVRLIARDLVYLAMSQAGASYSEIPRRFASNFRGSYVPDEFLGESRAPSADKGMGPAVKFAAELIGLERLRRAKSGPRPRR